MVDRVIAMAVFNIRFMAWTLQPQIVQFGAGSQVLSLTILLMGFLSVI